MKGEETLAAAVTGCPRLLNRYRSLGLEEMQPGVRLGCMRDRSGGLGLDEMKACGRGVEPDVASAELLCLKLGQLSWVRMATLA